MFGLCIFILAMAYTLENTQRTLGKYSRWLGL